MLVVYSDMAQSFEKVGNYFDKISNFFKDPLGNTANWLLTLLVSNSRGICLTGASIAILLYVLGIEKAGKYVGFFCLAFFLIQCIGAVL